MKLPAVPSYLYVIAKFTDGEVKPMYLRGWWGPRKDWVYFTQMACGFNTKSKAERVAFDLATADPDLLGKLIVERRPSNYVGTSEEKLSGISH